MLTYTAGEPFNSENLEVQIRWDYETAEYTWSVRYQGIHTAGSAASLQEAFEIAYRDAAEITEKWEVATQKMKQIKAEHEARAAGQNVYKFPSGELCE